MLPTLDVGGLGSLALELARAWKPGDEHVFVASRFPTTKPALATHFAPLGGVFQIPRTLMYPMSFVDSLRDMGPKLGAAELDLVIIYNWFDHVWYTMGLRRAGYRGPVLCHVGTRLPANEMVAKMLASPFTGGVRFVPASQAVRDALIIAGAGPGLVANVVWNGVDLNVFEPNETKQSGPLRVGFTGRMAPEAKDFEGLIRGWALMPEPVRARAQLLLVGDGPRRGVLQSLAKTLGVSDTVKFEGALARDLVPGFLRALDIFVMAALPIEGMSMALVEALATGLPVVASDVPANREVLHAAGAGHLVPQTPEGYAAGLEWLITDPGARNLLAGKSVASRRLFDIKVVAETYRRLGEREQGLDP
jgi:glycosyltransferase involved in cell wall biosynthesis